LEAKDVIACRMRKGIEVEVGADDRARLEAIVADRNRRQKHVERARIVLLTTDGVGTLAIMRQVGCAKATVWRWQERFAAAGVDGLLREKSWPLGRTPLARAVVEKVGDRPRWPPGISSYERPRIAGPPCCTSAKTRRRVTAVLKIHNAVL
jgi:hypothetical protein